MTSNFHPAFDLMDSLAESRTPFFFMINFMMDEVVVAKETELSNYGLSVDFQNFKSSPKQLNKNTKVDFNSSPEPFKTYELGFKKIQDEIHLGNSYLTNYTCRTGLETQMTLEDFYHSAKAKYKVLWKDHFTFFSPETFIEIKNNRIYTYPMKGTIDAAVPDAESLLKNDPKEKAEHYTVVDLLRNDLSMVANDVKVDEFQRIERLHTNNKDLLAMSSVISGSLKNQYHSRIGSILKLLLPAGSILGAPKPKTLEIVLNAELVPRGWYTGVAGWFDGNDLDSCVMIRFIEQHEGKLYFRSGGGVTHMSKAEDEYLEMKNKIYVPLY